MLRCRLWLTVLVGVALLAAQTSLAAAAPVVFDFEDGLQGWELHGSAQRIQTQVLAGEWAIFADARVGGGPFVALTYISMDIDVTNIRTISLQLLVIDGNGRRPAGVLGDPLTSFTFQPTCGVDNLWTIDVSAETGFGPFVIVWADNSSGWCARVT